jgi:hypothetical protein
MRTSTSFLAQQSLDLTQRLDLSLNRRRACGVILGLSTYALTVGRRKIRPAWRLDRCCAGSSTLSSTLSVLVTIILMTPRAVIAKNTDKSPRKKR